jgi:flagellar biosynthesis protein FliQ
MGEKSKLYLPIGIGFIGISVPLFISIFYATTRVSKISILITAIIILFLGILIVLPKSGNKS